jgi:hypothetical protein
LELYFTDFLWKKTENDRNVTAVSLKCRPYAAGMGSGMTKCGRWGDRFSTTCGKLCGKEPPQERDPRKSLVAYQKISPVNGLWKNSWKKADFPGDGCGEIRQKPWKTDFFRVGQGFSV